MRHFVIKYTPPRDTFLTDSTAEENAAVGKHFEYLTELLKKRVLVMAGRTDDAAYGIAVFAAENEAAAQDIVSHDPAVRAGVFSAELKPFMIALYGPA